MKKMFFTTSLVVFLSMGIFTNVANAADRKNETTEVSLSKEEADRKIKRLEEIKEMDLENLSRAEKKALRKEVKAIEADLQASNGVYLSTGAIIIILLVLILIL